MSFEEHMKEWDRVNDMHDALANQFLPLIRDYYGKAVDADVSNLSIDEMIEAHPFTIPRDENGNIDIFDSKLNAWRMAIFLDTMRLVQNEMTGGDDSTYDYIPDGTEQLQMFSNPEMDYVQLDVLTKSLTQFREQYETPYFQDCTSPILWAVVNDDEE